jgi:hypothetical protein
MSMRRVRWEALMAETKSRTRGVVDLGRVGHRRGGSLEKRLDGGECGACAFRGGIARGDAEGTGRFGARGTVDDLQGEQT